MIARLFIAFGWLAFLLMVVPHCFAERYLQDFLYLLLGTPALFLLMQSAINTRARTAVQALRSEDRHRRLRALRTLFYTNMGTASGSVSREVANQLGAMIDPSDSEMTQEILRVLRRYDSAFDANSCVVKVIPLLVYPEYREKSWTIIRRLRNAEAKVYPDLLALLDDSSREVRRAAAFVLTRVRLPKGEAVEKLGALLDEDDQKMLSIAISALAQQGANALKYLGRIEQIGRSLPPGKERRMVEAAARKLRMLS